MRDNKLGYHWVWVAPLVIAYTTVVKISTAVETYTHARRIKKIRAVNKEIDDLSKLAWN